MVIESLNHFSKKNYFLKILLSGTDHITLWLLGQCVHTKGMIILYIGKNFFLSACIIYTRVRLCVSEISTCVSNVFRIFALYRLNTRGNEAY